MNNYKAVIIDSGHGGVDAGFTDDEYNEKNFNLTISSYIYQRLKDMNFPVYMTRSEDETLSNYERYEFINEIMDDVGDALVFSIHIDNENSNGVSIIRSVNSDIDTNKDLYDKLGQISEVKTKTLINDENKDFYAIQRIIPDGNKIIVIEYGYNEIKDEEERINSLGEDIVDIVVNFFGDINFNSLGYEKYIVEKGDYLYKIAKRYNVTVDEIKRINDLGTDTLVIGQVLLVPKQKKNIYVVKKGDSLFSIAKKFNTNVDKIKDINNLISNKLVVNQKLLIPD